MTDEPILPESGEPDMTAAELALGVLEGDALALALRRVLTDPSFARDLAAWRAHFAQLFDIWPESEAPPGTLERIETSLGWRGNVSRTVRWWQGIAAATSLLAAACLAFVLLRPVAPVQPAARSAMLVAQIVPTGAGATLAAVFDPSDRTLRISRSGPAEQAAKAGKAEELWLIPADGVPRPIGMLASNGPTLVDVPAAHLEQFSGGVTLAVSIEPVGGSPTGKPTGPVIATGVVTRI